MNHTHNLKTKLTIPGHNSFLEMALAFVTNSAQLFKFSPQEVFQIRLGAEEAISNIIKHALSNNIEESFEITCLFKETQFEIVIHEKGKPFEAGKIVQYNPDEADIKGDAKGLGTFLIQKMMDKVEYLTIGRDGKETILIKYPKSQRIDNLLSVSSKEKPRVKEFAFDIRGFKEDDAIGISECAYSAYGYTYESYIYYPAQVIKMNHEHKLTSFVAQTDDNTIAGHTALKYDNNPSLAEIGVAFVKKEYRGKSIFHKLLDYAIDSVKSTSQLKCIFGEGVTSHTISQDALQDRNFIPTAITLALFPADLDFKSISGAVKQKDAALILCLNTQNEDEVREIYIPSRHEYITKDIFKSLNYKVQTKTTLAYKEIEYNNTKLEYEIVDIFNCGWMHCRNYSKNSINEIQNVLKILCLNRVDAIYLYLDLEDENMPHVAKECEAIGFFFSGIIPFAIHGRHAMIFQYLNNLTFDFNAIKLSHPQAITIKDYIYTCYNKTI